MAIDAQVHREDADSWTRDIDGHTGLVEVWDDELTAVATAFAAALRVADPAAHRARVAEAAREAGLRVLSAEWADWLLYFGLPVCPVELHGALRGQPAASERSGERG